MKNSKRLTNIILVLIVAAVAAAVLACGSDPEPDPTSVATATESQPTSTTGSGGSTESPNGHDRRQRTDGRPHSHDRPNKRVRYHTGAVPYPSAGRGDVRGEANGAGTGRDHRMDQHRAIHHGRPERQGCPRRLLDLHLRELHPHLPVPEGLEPEVRRPRPGHRGSSRPGVRV